MIQKGSNKLSANKNKLFIWKPASAMKSGIPQINNIKKYGMKNTPPPFS